jgi:hypothetical protein
MTVQNKLIELKISFKVKDFYPHHYLLIELKNNEVLFLDTEECVKKRHFSAMYSYEISCYNSLAYPHLIHFTEITHTKEGRKIMERYTSISRIHLYNKHDNTH